MCLSRVIRVRCPRLCLRLLGLHWCPLLRVRRWNRRIQFHRFRLVRVVGSMTTMSMVVTSPLMENLLLCIGASFVLLLNQTVSLVNLGLSVSIDGLPVETDVDEVVRYRRGGVVSWTDLSVPTPVAPWLVSRLTLDPIN